MKYLIVLFLFSAINTFGQILNESQIRFIQDNAVPIQLDQSLENGQWDALGKLVENKKIVSLGEFNHETWEVFKIKNDLIKYLQEEHGFNTILFEAGIGELIDPNLRKKELRPEEMTYGFFSYWRTQEFVELMEFVQEKRMNIAGFDVQRFGGSFESVLVAEAKKLEIDSAKYLNIESRFGHLKNRLTARGAKYDSVVLDTKRLISDYEKLLAVFNTKNTSGLVTQTIKNRIHYLDFRLLFLVDRDWNQRWLERDSMMAENVNWLIENFYPDEKIIIYAHNFHISKYNENEEVMGEYLDKRYGESMYTIGIFAGQGTFGDERKLSPPDTTKLDIKHIIQQLDQGTYFMDITRVKTGGEWLDNELIVNDTFIDLSNTNSMNLSDHFDGLILIDQIATKK